jgi:hypothetical protein
MKTEQVKTITDNALTQLMNMIEQGHSEALVRYLAAMSRFHRYSFHNCMLIYTQQPAATRVAGFHAWRKLGRFVCKGEKGIQILAPMVFKSEADANAQPSQEPKPRLGFKAAYVFDLSQTDGDPLPRLSSVAGDPQAHLASLKALVTAKAIALDYSESIRPALGCSAGGAITLLPGLSSAQEFSVLTHELAHEMLHQGTARAATTRTVRELEAEAVAFVVSQAVGLETGTAASDYIQLYSGDKTALAASLGAIQETAVAILRAVLDAETAPSETIQHANV